MKKYRAHTATGYTEFHDKAKALEVSANVEEIEYEDFPEPDYAAEQERQKLIESLRKTDADMARVAEDIIQILVQKGLISETDFPQAVKDKLGLRQNLRNLIKGE